MGMINVVRDGQLIPVPTLKGDPLRYEDLTTEQKAELRGIAIEKKTESEYAAMTPESGVLYIVTADT